MHVTYDITDPPRERDLELAKELFQALIDVGFIVCEPELYQAAIGVVEAASSGGSLPTLEYILTKIPLDKIPVSGSALYIPSAAARGMKGVVEFWLDRGLDPNVIVFYRDAHPDSGTTRQVAIDCAIRGGHTEVIKLLLGRGAKMVKLR